MTGGSSYEVHVEHAAAAIAAGVCDVVVSVYASTPRSDRTHRRSRGPARHARAEPDGRVGAARSGSASPWGPTRWRRRATCHEYGTTPEQLAADRGAHPGVGGAATRGRATATR